MIETKVTTNEEYALLAAPLIVKCYKNEPFETEAERMFICNTVMFAAYVRQHLPWLFNTIQISLEAELRERLTPPPPTSIFGRRRRAPRS